MFLFIFNFPLNLLWNDCKTNDSGYLTKCSCLVFWIWFCIAYIKQKFACVKKLLCKLDTSMKYIWNIWKKGNAYEAQYYYFVV